MATTTLPDELTNMLVTERTARDGGQYVNAYSVSYELLDRMGYKLTRAERTVHACTIDGAVSSIMLDARARCMTAEIIMVQEWSR